MDSHNVMLDPRSAIALRAVIAIIAAAVGGLIGVMGRQASHKVLCGMVSFAAGALLAVTVIHIVPETVEMIDLLPAVLTVTGGVVLFALIGKYVYFMCPACAASATEHDTGYLRLGILLLISMSIHSTVDGLAIAAGSATLSYVGVLILFAVSYHKVPEGLALVSVARLAGYGRGRALLITLLIELTTALGALIGLFFLSGVSELALGITLGIVAGSFLYTVGFAMLREMFVHERMSIFLYVGLGVASIVVTGLLIPHGPTH